MPSVWRVLVMQLSCWMVLVSAAFLLQAQAVSAKPEVWLMPPASENGKALHELFEHPDQWKETRSLIDVLGYTDLNFTKQFKDEELRQWFAMMRKWGLRLGLEVGALKPWGVTGEAVFDKERPMWERIQRLGGAIDAVAMDEPLKCCRMDINKTDEYAVRETAAYVALVREHFPGVRIGDIETYPSIPLKDHFWWIDALNDALAAKKVRGLDFYRLDVNWAVFVVRNEGGWKEVCQLERHCRARRMPFSLIYWAATYPVAALKGIADDAAWYVSLMQQGYERHRGRRAGSIRHRKLGGCAVALRARDGGLYVHPFGAGFCPHIRYEGTHCPCRPAAASEKETSRFGWGGSRLAGGRRRVCQGARPIRLLSPVGG